MPKAVYLTLIFLIFFTYIFFKPTFVKAEVLYTFDIQFYVEEQTKNKYPDYELKVRQLLDAINLSVSTADVKFNWRLKSSVSVYNKDTKTDCLAKYDNSKYLPSDYCKVKDYIVVVIDEVVSDVAYAWATPDYNSIEFHGIRGSFNSLEDNKKLLLHELMHIHGLPDIFHMHISSENNLVTGNEYHPFRYQIMDFLYEGIPAVFPEWNTLILNKIMTPKIPFVRDPIVNFQPKNNILVFKGMDSCKLQNSKIEIYRTETLDYRNSILPNNVFISGFLDNDGRYNLGGNPLGTDKDYKKSLVAFYIKVYNYENKFEYRWLNFQHIQSAYLKGLTENVYFSYNLNLPCSEKLLEGDFNNDKVLNKEDIQIFITRFFTDSNGFNGDLNHDGSITLSDLVSLIKNIAI